MRHDVRQLLAHLRHRPHLVVRITVLLAWTHGVSTT